jgi:hypothetical protein
MARHQKTRTTMTAMATVTAQVTTAAVLSMHGTLVLVPLSPKTRR